MKKIMLFGALLLLSSQAHAQFTFQPQSVNAVYAYCFNANGQTVPNCNVTISNGYYFVPAQHNHDSPPPPLSTILPASGNTGTTGLLVLIGTTHVGQIEGAVVCADLCTVTDYIVAWNDFFQLTGGGNYVLIGSTTPHPNNHHGTFATLSGIQLTANQYHSEFPAYPVIGINDSALPLGGQFDLRLDWASPHSAHGRGKAVDVRGDDAKANSIPRIPAVQQRFREICVNNGATVTFHESVGESNEHFHCQWP